MASLTNMAAPSKSGVDLGFVEEDCDKRLLRSHFFPSKVGGRAAWLSLTDLPIPDDMLCSVCEEPCVFLLQIYAPDELLARCFHRTIFLFLCRNPKCYVVNSNKTFRVFRSQLSKENDFYSSVPPNENDPDEIPEGTSEMGVALCVVCGSTGPKRCAKCHDTSYCGKKHQTLHWKNGHKQKCGQNVENDSIPNLLFPEVEVVMEEETNSKDLDVKEKSEAEKLQEYEEYLQANKDTLSGLDKNELEKSAVSENHDDKQFAKFKARIAVSPDQVLRYKRGGEPLWVAVTHQPTPEDIPACPCGAPREFEFQILPQLLIHLKVDSLGDSIDWGTLCIYTCSKRCDIGNRYQEEFLWKQDIAGGTEES